VPLSLQWRRLRGLCFFLGWRELFEDWRAWELFVVSLFEVESNEVFLEVIVVHELTFFGRLKGRAACRPFTHCTAESRRQQENPTLPRVWFEVAGWLQAPAVELEREDDVTSIEFAKTCFRCTQRANRKLRDFPLDDFNERGQRRSTCPQVDAGLSQDWVVLPWCCEKGVAHRSRPLHQSDGQSCSWRCFQRPLVATGALEPSFGSLGKPQVLEVDHRVEEEKRFGVPVHGTLEHSHGERSKLEFLEAELLGGVCEGRSHCWIGWLDFGL